MNEWFPKRTIGMLPAEAARRWGECEALAFKDQRWTYRQFDIEVDGVARALIASGVEVGEHVAMWIPNRPQFLFLYYAIIKVGAVVVPLNTRFRTMDLDYALRQSDCATLITVDRSGPVEYGKMAAEVLGPIEVLPNGRVRSSTCPKMRRVIVLDQGEDVPGALSWQAFLTGESAVPDADLAARAAAVDPDGASMIMYTSGTTGYPKGVMLSHMIIRRCVERLAAMGMTKADVLLNYLPAFHMYSLGHIMLQSILSGAKQVLTETFDPTESLHLIATERVTALHGFDTHYRELIEAKRREPSVDLSSLRIGLLTAGLENVVPIAMETQRQLCPTVSALGSTETASAFSLTFLDGTLDQRTRASGYPLPDVDVRIIDPITGLDVAPGEQGEILVRAYGNMIGYYNNPTATAEAIDVEGWFHTGDICVMREDGHVRFVGRYKDLLKVGGENVSPAEVEYMLLQIPGVEQVAIVGFPDPRLHEVVAAFVVPAPGMSVTLELVDGFCRGKIASYKIPRRVIVVEQLPMTPSGKVQKHLLRKQLG